MPLTKMQIACLVLFLSVLACSQDIPSQKPAASPSTGNPFTLVEQLATGTAVAQTQVAQTQLSGMELIESWATGTAQAKTATVPAPGVISHDHESLIPVLMVVLPDGARHTFTYSLLEQLSTHSLDLFDKPRPAIYLRVLLDQTGWQAQPNFSLTLEGRTSMTFLVDRLPDDAALWLDEGRVHFVSGEIPAEEWVNEVALILLH
jgi:hypothetical protein